MTTPVQQIITRIGIRETARITGVPRASIGLWIAGERPMSPERQRQIADALIDWLTGQARALRACRPRRRSSEQ